MTAAEFRKIALSLPDTEEHPHFDRAAFKLVKRRIFATLHEASNIANLKLSVIDQSVFCQYNPEFIYAVPNKWGLQGWTTFVLAKIPKTVVRDALQVAYQDAAQPKRNKK